MLRKYEKDNEDLIYPLFSGKILSFKNTEIMIITPPPSPFEASFAFNNYVKYSSTPPYIYVYIYKNYILCYLYDFVNTEILLHQYNTKKQKSGFYNLFDHVV